MIRANCDFVHATHDDKYLKEAKRIGHAALAHWVAPDGSIHDAGKFVHLLLDSFLILSRNDPDPRWKDAVGRASAFVHEHVRDPDGRYSSRWYADPRERTARRFSLIDQASVARADWEAAAAFAVKP